MSLSCCFGCFLRPGRGRKVKSDEWFEISYVDTKTSDDGDLSTDEGANLQQDLWEELLTKKLRRYKQQALDNVQLEGIKESSPERFLQALSASYSERNFTQRIVKVRELFLGVEPFIMSINTMVASSTIASLVWGSLSLVFVYVLKFAALFEDTFKMFFELSRALPRFKEAVAIFHTPQLHRALRDVYAGYIDFCFKLVEIFQANKCWTMMRGRWSGFEQEYQDTKSWLLLAQSEFEKETRLADMQTQSKRHDELLTRFDSITTRGSGTIKDPVTNLSLPRNERFTGREQVLLQLHTKLAPSFQGEVHARARSSGVIHSLGGMGKTEVALEYAYRYSFCYSYVFWLRSQTVTSLQETFLQVVQKLGLDEKGTDTEKKIQAGLQWFQSATEPWILIYDNVEDFETIRKFWPAGNRGTILLTTQNPLLALNTKFELHLQPMSAEEGSSLIQSYLNRGRSEQEPAERLSTSLGGLPLAIAHFAGYVARSQCPMEQICNSFNKRIRSSQIWTSKVSLTNEAYELTLQTVWTLAMQRLTEHARHLLELIAFLDPDQIPVEMFIGSRATANVTEWQYWDIERFNEAIGILRERHLVERYSLPNGDYLRTHRALQRATLQDLDKTPKKRGIVFDNVVSMAREAFPAANIITRGDTSQYTQSAKYLPQVLSIHKNFKESDPPIEDRLDFAKLLSDVGYYGVNNAVQEAVLELLETGERICSALLESCDQEVRPILGDILGPLIVLVQYLGHEGRHRAVLMGQRAIENRKLQLQTKPEENWTTLDCVNIARAHNDMGFSLAQLNRIDEAAPLFEQALGFLKMGGTEETLTSRFGQTHYFRLWAPAVHQKAEEAVTLSIKSRTLIAKAVGADSPLSLQANSITANVLFTLGRLQEAQELHEKVYNKRLTFHGTNHHLTLESQYNLAVCHHNLDQLETAETLLKGIITNGVITMFWRREDVTRTKFRLLVVLKAGNRRAEASKMQDDIAQDLSRISSSSPSSSSSKEADRLPTSDKQYMELLDSDLNKTGKFFSRDLPEFMHNTLNSVPFEVVTEGEESLGHERGGAN